MRRQHLFFALEDNDVWQIVEIRPEQLLNPARFEAAGFQFQRMHDRLIFVDRDERLEVAEELVTGDMLWVRQSSLIFAESAAEAQAQIDQAMTLGQPHLLELEIATLNRHGRRFVASRSRR